MFSLSLLPESLSWIEYYLSRLFLLLAFLTIGPWFFLILYDFLLYLFRVVSYEIPIVGGRARGKVRPRAPSVAVRPDGRRRGFSFVGVGQEDGKESGKPVGFRGGFDGVGETDNERKTSRGTKRVLAEEEREMNTWEIIGEENGKKDSG